MVTNLMHGRVHGFGEETSNLHSVVPRLGCGALKDLGHNLSLLVLSALSEIGGIVEAGGLGGGHDSEEGSDSKLG